MADNPGIWRFSSDGRNEKPGIPGIFVSFGSVPESVSRQVPDAGDRARVGMKRVLSGGSRTENDNPDQKEN
ncbi:MAG: hypothetical protein STSR0009_25090 [Methanoregula sp.]